MVGRFGHVTATLVVVALMAAPEAVSAAAAAAPAVDGPTTARIGLAGADPDALRAFAAAVSDPHSAQYRHFLTPAQEQERFGPTAAQVKKVHAWLAGSGLSVTGENSHWIDVTGTPEKIKRAFGHLPQPRSARGGDYADRAASAVPAVLSGAVSSVAGLGPERSGVRQFSYRVVAGPRGKVLSGGGVNPGGPMQPAAPGTSQVPAKTGGPVAPSAGAGVNPGGPMRPTGPGVSAGPDSPAGPGAPAGVNPGGPMQPASPSQPVIVGGPVKRSLPARPGDPGLPITASTACSTDWGASPATGMPQGYNKPDPLVLCGYTPKRLRAAYGITAAKVTGKGAVIGIVDAYGSPTMRADADKFAASVGDKAFGDAQYAESVDRATWKHLGDGVCETPAVWGGEEALDVEIAHGLAPDADVHYFGAASCQDQDISATLASIVDHHSADVVTGSFGEIMHPAGGNIDPAVVRQENQLFATGAAEGIGFVFATGDCGDLAPGLGGPACDTGSARTQVEWPGASPWVTAVGGTALAVGPTGKRHWEVPMGDLRSDLSDDGSTWTPFPGQFFFGGGGGVSADFDQPAYQKGVVPKDLALSAGSADTAKTDTGDRSSSGSSSTAGASPAKTATPKRTVPDIAMDGDLLTAVLTGHTDPTLGGYGQDVVGGTSAAAPMFAAVQADAMQASGGAVGFANPALYKRAGTKQFTDIVGSPKGAPSPISAVVDHGMFGDVHEAGLFRLGADHGLSARKGYDLATGLGSPTAAYIDSFKPKKKP